MAEDWLDRWSTGRTGWHESGGNAGLKAHWPRLPTGSTVLVPLCGKSPDLLWLAKSGCKVIGVELSEIAVRDFFSDYDLAVTREEDQQLVRYIASDIAIEVIQGDYFDFDDVGFDALYDRGALVALPPELRPRYVAHTKNLLKADAIRLIVTLEYEQSLVSGPPYSVLPTELEHYWDDLVLVEQKDDLESCPPKFRAAGLQEIGENFWLSENSPAG